MSQRVALLAPLVFLFIAASALGSGGVYTTMKHGDPFNGVQRAMDRPRGDCSQCHDEHASRQGVGNGGPYPFALFAINNNALCATCHSPASMLQIYPGAIAYTASAHSMSPSTIWPGPVPIGRPSSDAGKCVNCHTPHGAKDANGSIPSLTFAREEVPCLSCHDGSPASTDLASLFRKTFTHPISLIGKHNQAEAGDPTRFAGSNRHAECVDCHNPHAAQADPAPPRAPDASNRLRGVSRVTVTNGAAGSRPLYTWTGPQDSAFAREYELCFKCHSSWTTLPVSKTDLALLLNPANASFHPVEQAGRSNIAAASFAGTWTRTSLTYCSDCHGSDDSAPTPRGPHGSSYQYLLKGRYETGIAGGAMQPTDLCFSCHLYATYANPSAPSAVLGASRFNPPSGAYGHAFHVGGKGQTCWSCHESHGSVLQPSLVTTTRVPGMGTYVQTTSGGTCSPSCHQSAGSRTYTTNYGR